MRGRIKKVEERAYGGPTPPCPECGDKIIEEEILEDGTVRYPGGEPCGACGSRGDAASGRVSRIVVDMRDRRDRPEDDGFTFVEWPY